MDPVTNQNPIANGTQMPLVAERKPIGPIAGAIIVIVLLVAGGLYFWGAKLNSQISVETPYIPDDNTYMMPEGSLPAGELQSDTSAGLPPQSNSDDIAAIESDFNAMNMQQMEAENQAEMNNI